MAKTKKKEQKPKLDLPPVPEIRVVELNIEERQALVGLLSVAAEWPHVPLERKRWMARLSDKIMPEEEAARMLQDMGYEIVKKETRRGK